MINEFLKDHFVNPISILILIYILQFLTLIIKTATTILQIVFSTQVLIPIGFFITQNTLLKKKSRLYYKKIKSFNDFIIGISTYEPIFFKVLKVFLFVIFWLCIVAGLAKALLHLVPYQNDLIAGLFNKEFLKNALSTIFSFFFFASAIKTSYYMIMGKIKKLSDVNLKMLLWM